MADSDATTVEPSTLDFGGVVVGNTKSLTLTFYNLSSPAGSQDIELNVSAHFTLDAGSDAFTLANYGDHRHVIVTYTPDAVESNDTTFTWTTTADVYFPSSNIAVLADGATSDLTAYTLPTIYNTASGDIKVRLYVNEAIPALTVPTVCQFLNIGSQRESIDAEAGTTEFDNIEIDIAEDYTTYSQGFWHKLINEYPAYDFEMMFTIMEGTDETFLFRGKIYRVNIEETEHYLSSTTGTPTTAVRGLKFRLVSSLKVLEEVAVVDLIPEIKARALSATHIQLDEVFATMIHMAYGEAYSITTIVNNSTDIQLALWIDGTLGYHSFLDGCIPNVYVETNITTYPTCWLARFKTAYELFLHLCGQFGCVPRYTFGDANLLYDNSTPANNITRITLNARGRSTGTAVTMTGNVMSSTFRSGTARKSRRIKVGSIVPISDPPDAPSFTIWYADDVLHEFIEPGSPEEFDIIKTVDFSGSKLYGAPLTYLSVTGSSDAADWLAVDYGHYWDYTLGSYVDFYGAPNWLGRVLARYLFARMGEGRVEYTRKYGSIKANNGTTNSQRNCKTLIRHAIHDGVSSRTFYATEVSKDMTKNEATIVWVQE
jgi:hypothetical protein